MGTLIFFRLALYPHLQIWNEARVRDRELVHFFLVFHVRVVGTSRNV